MRRDRIDLDAPPGRELAGCAESTYPKRDRAASSPSEKLRRRARRSSLANRPVDAGGFPGFVRDGEETKPVGSNSSHHLSAECCSKRRIRGWRSDGSSIWRHAVRQSLNRRGIACHAPAGNSAHFVAPRETTLISAPPSGAVDAESPGMPLICGGLERVSHDDRTGGSTSITVRR